MQNLSILLLNIIQFNLTLCLTPLPFDTPLTLLLTSYYSTYYIITPPPLFSLPYFLLFNHSKKNNKWTLFMYFLLPTLYILSTVIITHIIPYKILWLHPSYLISLTYFYLLLYVIIYLLSLFFIIIYYLLPAPPFTPFGSASVKHIL